MSEDKGYLQVKDRMPESLIKRMMDFAGPEYGTPCGLMMLRGEITKSQYAACKWFEDLYRGYLKAIDGPKGIRTSTGQRIDPGHAPDPFSPIGWEIAADERKTIRLFDSARMAGMAYGSEAFRVFWRVVINGEDPNKLYMAKLRVKTVADAIDKHRSRGWKSRKKDKIVRLTPV